jgi:hypothetical protein
MRLTVSGSRSCQASAQARHPPGQVSLDMAIAVPKESAAFSQCASTFSGPERGVQILGVVFAVLGYVKPRPGGMPASLQRDRVPRSLGLLAQTHTRQGAGAVHGDGLVALRFPGLEQSLHGQIETGQRLCVATLARIGTPQAPEVAWVHRGRCTTAAPGRRELKCQYSQYQGHGDDVLAIVLEHISQLPTVP